MIQYHKLINDKEAVIIKSPILQRPETTYTKSRKRGDPLHDWKPVCENHEKHPYVATEVCDKCDFHSHAIGEHLGVTNKYYYCNYHGAGHGSIAEIHLKTNLLRMDIGFYSFDTMNGLHHVPFSDCPFYLEHLLCNRKGVVYPKYEHKGVVSQI